jgi:transcriptional regulator with PAS, ATPase and Fis domain
VKLLRVLQDRTYEVLGSSTTRQVDVRVVAATNRNLPDMVGRGLFREDLLYRLNLIAIHLPPLRERGGDIARLARQFLGTLASVYRRDRLELASPALRFLETQSWPGNIRQLKQFVERAVLISPDAQVLDVGHLQATAAMEAGVGAAPIADAPTAGAAADNLPVVGSMTIDEIEKAMIEKALRHHQGNLSRVAESLGLSRAALYRRLERYGIPT